MRSGLMPLDNILDVCLISYFYNFVEKITKKDYEKLLVKYNNQCWICEVELTTVFWDHVQPLAKGGAHTVDNLRPACNPCNVRKNATWPFTEDMKNRIANEVRLLNSIGGDA